jgi:putative phosphoesterase
MIIAVISDTHDNLATIDKFLDFIGKNPAHAIIHCGDIASGETLAHLADNFGGKIFAALGNMDYRESLKTTAQKSTKKILLLDDVGKISIGGLKICFSHFKESAQKACQDNLPDFIFYGHTHKPWLEKKGACQIANPGNLANIIYKPTFAMLNTQTKQLELKILDRLQTI